jgi:outer membrane protein assembly factor BamA
MSVRLRIFFTIFLAYQFTVEAQLHFVFSNDFPQELKKITQSIPQDIQEKEWPVYATKIQVAAYGLGYFLFEAKMIQHPDSNQVVELFAGKRFDYLELQQHNTVQKIEPKDFENLVTDSLSYYLNNGFPFVKISLMSISADQPKFQLQIDPGPPIIIGRIIVKPEGIIQPKVIAQLLRLDSGAAFSIEQLKQIRSSLSNQSGFKLMREPEWLVQEGQADIYIYLERIKSSSATGIVGLQPNPLTQKNALVGELQINLQNTWQKNEKLFLNWRSIAPQVQLLQVQLNWPYIASSAYGLQTGLKLYKRDTTFIEFKSQVGVQYQLPQAWQILGLLDFWRSSNLSNTPNFQVANFRNLSYGLALQRRTLNNWFNPTKGQVFYGQFLVGTKKVTQAHLTWRLEIQQQQFVPLAKRHTLLFQQQLGHISSDSLFRNELYRFGGLERMRGFDEEAFFASSFAVAGLEYRFLLDEFAYASLFTDWAAFSNQTLSAPIEWVSAIGLGLAIGSDKGLFKLNYALGAFMGQPYQFSSGKIHLAYISYF